MVIKDKLHQQYQSLLGATAWLCQTRVDICVYVTALQRATSSATIGHVVRLNKLVRYVRHKESYLSYPSFGSNTKTFEQLKLLCISDSAYRREDPSCLAMRGSLIALCLPDGETTPGGVMHTLEFFSRRQRKITRSTFAAATS